MCPSEARAIGQIVRLTIAGAASAKCRRGKNRGRRDELALAIEDP